MKISFFVLLAIYFATLVDDSISTPLLSFKKRSKRSPQFVQNYAPGSQSQNFNCQSGGGCGNIGGLQNIRGSHVSNYGLEFRQDYHGGSSATNLNVAGPLPVLNPAPHHQANGHLIAGPQGAVQQVATPEVAVQQVTSPEVAIQQVAGPEVVIQQVAGTEVAIQQVANPEVAIQQVAVQQVARHQVPGLPVGGHHITGHQVPRYPVARYPIARHPVTNHQAARHLVARHQAASNQPTRHQVARFKRSPQFFQSFSAGAQSVNCPN
jgi:hypothetical protein